jgi:hypothetical protein
MDFGRHRNWPDWQDPAAVFRILPGLWQGWMDFWGGYGSGGEKEAFLLEFVEIPIV